MKNKYLPLIIISVYFFIFYLAVRGITGDDVNYFFPMAQSDISIFDYLKLRYNEWTSRLFIETILILLLKAPFIVWKLLTGISMCALIWSIYFLFFNKQKTHVIWIFCSFMLLCNFPILSASAGWVATTLNYIWTSAALFIAFIPIKLIEEENKSNKPYYLIFLLFAIFASNQELFLIPIFIAAFVFLVRSIKRKKHEFYYYSLIIISIASLIFILTCPGNTVRFFEEIKNYFPIYGELSLMQKSIIGFNVIFNYIVLLNSPIFIFSAIFYVLIIFLDKKEKFIYRIISLIPFFGFIIGFIFILLPELVKLFMGEKFNGLVELNMQLSTNVAVAIIVLLSYILCFYIAIKNIAKNTLMYIIIISGFLSQFIMSFSPTIYASDLRSATLLFIALAIAGTAIFSKYSEQKEEKISKFLMVLIVSVAVLWNIPGTIYRLFL